MRATCGSRSGCHTIRTTRAGHRRFSALPAALGRRPKPIRWRTRWRMAIGRARRISPTKPHRCRTGPSACGEGGRPEDRRLRAAAHVHRGLLRTALRRLRQACPAGSCHPRKAGEQGGAGQRLAAYRELPVAPKGDYLASKASHERALALHTELGDRIDAQRSLVCGISSSVSWSSLCVSFVFQQIGQRRGAGLRAGLEQGVEAKLPVATAITGRELAWAASMSRGVSPTTQMRCSGQLAGLAGRVADQFRAIRKAVAEAAKAEPFAQAGLFDLDPADGLKVAGGHAQQSAALRQVSAGSPQCPA